MVRSGRRREMDWEAVGAVLAYAVLYVILGVLLLAAALLLAVIMGAM